MKAALYNSMNGLRTMVSNRLAVFAASLQCTDEVKVVSRVSDAGDWRDLKKEKKTRKEREIPNNEV